MRDHKFLESDLHLCAALTRLWRHPPADTRRYLSYILARDHANSDTGIRAIRSQMEENNMVYLEEQIKN